MSKLKLHHIFTLIMVLFMLSIFYSDSRAAQIGIYTNQANYSNGDLINVDFSFTNDGPTSSFDIYLALLVPSNNVYFFPGWSQFVTSISIQLESGFTFPKTTIFQFPIPNVNPPIGDLGSYVFATGATITGQTDFMTGIQIAPFQIVKNSRNFTCYSNGNMINSILCFEDYLLSGTTGGLIKWDTINETYEKLTTQNGLAGGDVRSIIYDEINGGFWIATNGGISFYDGSGFTNYTTDNGLDTDDILSITLDKDNNLWCGTEGFGINILSEGQVITKYDSSNYLPDNVILSMTLDKLDNIWIGTENGAISFDGLVWTSYTNLINVGINGSIIRKIAVDDYNKKYFAVANSSDHYGGNGVSILDNGEWSYFRDTNEYDLIDDRVFDIYPDQNGNIWFATWLGLSSLSNDEWNLNSWGDWITSVNSNNDALFFGSKFNGIGKLYQDEEYFITTKNEPVSNGISSFAFDSNNNLWIGSDMPILGGDGVSMFDGEEFFNHNLNFISNSIKAMAVGNDNTVYAGTSYGMAYYKNNNWDTFRTEDSLINNDIKCLAVDYQGNLWIGTSSGISVYDNGTWTEYTTKKGLPGDDISDIFVDSFNRVWIATTTGIAIFDNGIWTTVYYDGEPYSGWMFSIAVDQNGIGWGGLYENFVKIDLSKEGNHVQYLGYSTQIGELLDDTIITDIQTSSVDGSIWLATDSNGIIVYSPDKIEHLTTKNGLPSKIVNALLFDSMNNLWCGTTNGIIKFTNP